MNKPMMALLLVPALLLLGGCPSMVAPMSEDIEYILEHSDCFGEHATVEHEGFDSIEGKWGTYNVDGDWGVLTMYEFHADGNWAWEDYWAEFTEDGTISMSFSTRDEGTWEIIDGDVLVTLERSFVFGDDGPDVNGEVRRYLVAVEGDVMSIMVDPEGLSDEDIGPDRTFHRFDSCE